MDLFMHRLWYLKSLVVLHEFGDVPSFGNQIFIHMFICSCTAFSDDYIWSFPVRSKLYLLMVILYSQRLPLKQDLQLEDFEVWHLCCSMICYWQTASQTWAHSQRSSSKLRLDLRSLVFYKSFHSLAYKFSIAGTWTGMMTFVP